MERGGVGWCGDMVGWALREVRPADIGWMGWGMVVLAVPALCGILRACK